MITLVMKTLELPMSTRPPSHSVMATPGGSQKPEMTPNLARARMRLSTRLLLRVDGGFEAVLGTLLVLSPATGLYTALELPTPATTAVVIALGLLLLPLFPILWLAARAPQRWFVQTLATANGVS